MKKLSGYLLSLLLLVFCQSVWALELTAQLDRREVVEGDTFTLLLSADERPSEQPDFSVLDDLFEVQQVGRNSSTKLINGEFSQQYSWQVLLAAKQAGTLVIPSFELDGTRSEPLTVKVSPQGELPARTERFEVSLSIDKPQLWVGQQGILTFKVLYRERIGDLRWQIPQQPGLELVELKEQQYQTRRQGRDYGVYELRYAVFAEQPGAFTIPGFEVEFRTGRSSLLGAGQRKRLKVQPLRFTAQPLPSGRSGLVADSLTLQESWGQNPATLTVGQSVTRTITLSAEGAATAQLPLLDMAPIAGVNIYPEPLQSVDDKSEKGLGSARQLTLALVATQPGSLTLPAMEIPWFDALSGQWKTARLPSRQITVVADPNNPVTVQIEQPIAQSELSEPVAEPVAQTPRISSSSDLWPCLVASNLLWLVVLGWILYRRRDTKPVVVESIDNTSEQQAFKALVKALRTAQAESVLLQLNVWLAECYRLGWITQRGSEGLTARYPTDALIEQLASLNSALYSQQAGPGPNFSELEQQLQLARQQLQLVPAQTASLQEPFPER